MCPPPFFCTGQLQSFAYKNVFCEIQVFVFSRVDELLIGVCIETHFVIIGLFKYRSKFENIYNTIYNQDVVFMISYMLILFYRLYMTGCRLLEMIMIIIITIAESSITKCIFIQNLKETTFAYFFFFLRNFILLTWLEECGQSSFQMYIFIA